MEYSTFHVRNCACDWLEMTSHVTSFIRPAGRRSNNNRTGFRVSRSKIEKRTLQRNWWRVCGCEILASHIPNAVILIGGGSRIFPMRSF
eukprot:1176750-Prorocentrum_minimum.AAC.2